MSTSPNHREVFPGKSNPVDRIREGTNRRVWNRAGTVLHSIVDGTGAFLAKGAAIAETGFEHGGKVFGSLARIAGTVVGSAADMLSGAVTSFQKAKRKHPKHGSD